MARINGQMTEEFLNKMVKAGCKQIAYGIESGSQKVLNLMHKDYNVSIIDEVILNTYKAGIKPGINLMLGFPGEGEEDFRQTCELAKRNGKYLFYVNITTLGIEPLTDIYINRIKMGIDFKNSVDWQTADGTNNYKIRTKRAKKLEKVINDYVGKAVTFNGAQKQPIYF
jgi:coproporphyrinogen III oxidase-like Fe-S oxidoreductase